MKNQLIYQLAILIALSSFSCQSKNSTPTKQSKEQFVQPYKPSSEFNHLQHIRSNSKTGHLDGEEHDAKYFVDYVIENLLETPEYRKYITDRRLLRKLTNQDCRNNYVLIQDSLTNGKEIKIEIKTQSFKAKNRQLKFHDKSNFLIEIDGMHPYGAIYTKKPTKELEALSIQINGKKLRTSIQNYQNLYEPKFCNFGGHQKITEAYQDGKNIYIYMFGGNSAASYFAKLIFDAEVGYITSIIADYGPLSQYGCFGDHFIGY